MANSITTPDDGLLEVIWKVASGLITAGILWLFTKLAKLTERVAIIESTHWTPETQQTVLNQLTELSTEIRLVLEDRVETRQTLQDLSKKVDFILAGIRRRNHENPN